MPAPAPGPSRDQVRLTGMRPRLGNLPQASSHMGLIQSALLLEQLAEQSSPHRGAVSVPARRSPSLGSLQNRRALMSQHA